MPGQALLLNAVVRLLMPSLKLGQNLCANFLMAGLNIALAALFGSLVIYSLYRVYRSKARSARVEGENALEVYLRTAEALAAATHRHNEITDERLQRLRAYAAEVAARLDLPTDEQDALRTAALLHDVGKLAVPEHILRKHGRLTPEETEKMKIHPVAGAEMLKNLQLPAAVIRIVRSHHERWDGSGYPDGLKGRRIPMGARILSAVEFLDALIFNQQSRQSIPLHQAMERVRERSGKAFDPEVVEALERCTAGLEGLARAQNKSLAELLKQTPVYGHRPNDSESGEGFFNAVVAARQEDHILFELFQDLGNSLKLDEMFTVLNVRLRQLLPYDAIAAWVLGDNHLAPEYVSGQDFRFFASLRIPLGEGVSGWVAENHKPVVNGAPSLEASGQDHAAGFTSLRSAISIPLHGQYSVVGVLTLYAAAANAYQTDHLRVLETIASKLAACVENALSFQQAQDLATTDCLTGLPNARSLFDQLDREVARCKRMKTSLTVMVCDLDGFKHINDHFGHLEGNRILRVFAGKLQNSCRDYDYVARMGGDEFVIVAPGLSSSAAQASGMRLSELARSSGREICGEDLLSLSVGYAVYPDDGTDAEKLLAEADRRMYLEKQHHHSARAAYARLTNNDNGSDNRLIQ